MMKRIGELKAENERLRMEQRLKAVPVEAHLLNRVAELKAKVERLTKAGDNMASALWPAIPQAVYEVTDWEKAKEDKEDE